MLDKIGNTSLYNCIHTHTRTRTVHTHTEEHACGCNVNPCAHLRATQTTPVPHLPLPTSSKYHASAPSAIEKP